MKKIIKLSLTAALVLGLSNTANALLIDGVLSDWGIGTQWTPSSNADGKGIYQHDGLDIYYTVEDYTSGNGHIGPGWGGQAYDAEALYVTWDASNLYIALVTGHDPTTAQNPGINSYAAGDFALNFWAGSDNGSYEFGILNPKAQGNYSASVYNTTNASWNKDPLWSTGTVTSLNNPTNPIGTATMSIVQGPNNLGSNANHWIYEMSISRALFSGLDDPGSKLNVSWAMNCANDIIQSDPTTPVPEPATLALLGLSLPAVAWQRRRQARRQK